MQINAYTLVHSDLFYQGNDKLQYIFSMFVSIFK